MEWVFEGDRPLWIQLSSQLRQRIVTGVYPVGQRLPAVRELAEDAGVNPNTMQRALSQLEAEGIVASNRTAGRIVTDNKEVLEKVRTEMAEDRIEEFMRSMQVLGFSLDEIKALLEKRRSV